MKAILLRRRKLGFTSCKEISKLSVNELNVVRNDHPIPRDTDLVFRWGCTSNIPTDNVVNTSAAIHQVNNKAAFRKVLDENELCSATWTDVDEFEKEFDGWEDWEMVVRPGYHAQGRHLYVCRTIEEVRDAVRKCNQGHGYYISELIHKVEEYRVAFVQGRVAWVAKKTPGNPNEVAWNVAKGGRFDNVRWDGWPLKAVKVAREAFLLTDLDFGGVDIMIDANGEVYVLEINSAPSLTSPYRQQCMAKCFDYIIENGKARIDVVEERGGHMKFIHPALTEKARMVRN